MILMRANLLLGPLEGVGPCNGCCPLQNHYVPRQIKNWYINSYNFSKIATDVGDQGDCVGGRGARATLTLLYLSKTTKESTMKTVRKATRKEAS